VKVIIIITKKTQKTPKNELKKILNKLVKNPQKPLKTLLQSAITLREISRHFLCFHLNAVALNLMIGQKKIIAYSNSSGCNYQQLTKNEKMVKN
jgi:hypothetical protein